jgi:(Z)-2-((N-methylformamido)methylene)-5-hydroxybutyrolactone dehydrogenase
LETYRLHIAGKWTEPATGKSFESYNPYTAKPWALIPRGGVEDANRAVEAAYRAFTEGEWPKLTATARGALLRKLGDLIAENAEHLAAIEVRDNGKLIAEMRAQLNYLPQWYYYYGGLADKIEGSVIPSDKPGMFNYTLYEPYGVVVTITPWNSPLMLMTWKVAPALAAGNTVVVKPSEYTSASMLEFMKLVDKAGFPPGVINVVTGFGNEVGETLVTHPKVARVAFTGGELGGQKVYEAAARELKPVSLELGGKSGIFAASGQTCIAGSRLLLQDSIYDEFLEKLVAFAQTARIGDPASMETQVGPVATKPQYEKILSYIEIAKREGARCVLGGGPANPADVGEGWFVKPTIFADVTNKMRIAQEEVFGPVLSVIRFKDEDDAIRIANDVLYGLAAGVWTQNVRRAITVSSQLKAGTVWVNTYRATSFISPFGGYKRSGLGRENGQEAIKSYLQVKSVWISTATDVPNPFIMR